jgi:hypothetical protein
MIHGINNNYLYAVSKIIVNCKKEGDEDIESSGTGFFVVKENEPYFITNRHVLNIEIQDIKYKGYQPVEMSIDKRHYDDEKKAVITSAF